MSIRAHLSKMAATLGEHFAHVAQCLKTDMEACENSEDREAFRKLVDRHAETASACAECAKALGKSDADGELDKVMPLPRGLTTLHDAPPQVIRAIPRTGSAPIQKAEASEIFSEVFGSESEHTQ
jgi:hypothetical protein